MTGLKLCSLEREWPVLNVLNGRAQRDASSEKIYRKTLVIIQGLTISTPNRSWVGRRGKIQEEFTEGEPQT